MLYTEMTAILAADRQNAARNARSFREDFQLLQGLNPRLLEDARENVREYLRTFRNWEVRRIRALRNVCEDLFHAADVHLHFTDGTVRTVQCEYNSGQWFITTGGHWTALLEGIGANLAVRFTVDDARIRWLNDGLVLQGMTVQTTRAYTATVYWNHTPIDLKVVCTGNRWTHVHGPQPTPLGEGLTPHQAVALAAEQLADDAWVSAEVKLDVTHIQHHF
ncbi:hypothetical protein [Deinococcus ficus]|uniref:Uncharacterized protein n=1 Tax=Deinococcus ficus TaxID=317577 RepID=A0A221T309_9DEIO|nr:hypothetical protein [Deinococcus ficus]ASN83275.1 hypothetical protein DFI_18935 [Deinococcus ficus]